MIEIKSVTETKSTQLDVTASIVSEYLSKYSSHDFVLQNDRCKISDNGEVVATISSCSNNGRSNWSDYLDGLRRLLLDLEDDSRINSAYLLSVKVASLDCIFEATIGIQLDNELATLYPKADTLSYLIQDSLARVEECVDRIRQADNEFVHSRVLDCIEELKQLDKYSGMLRALRPEVKEDTNNE